MSDDNKNDPDIENEEFDEFEDEFDSESEAEYAAPGGEDGFAQDEFAEDDFEAEWEDEEFEEADTSGLTTRGKKPFLNFNTLVIGGGLALGLGLFAMQIFGSKEKVAPENLPAQTIRMDSSRDNIAFRGTRDEETEEVTPGSPSGGFLRGASKSEEPIQPRKNMPVVVEDAPPTPAPFTQSGKQTAIPQRETTPERPDPLTPMPGNGAGQDAQPGELPSLDQSQRDNRLAQLQDLQSPAETESPQVAPTEVSAQLDEITERLQALEESVNEASEKADQAIQAKASPANDSSGASSSEIAALKKSISRLENKIAALEKAPAPQAAASSSRSAPATTTQKKTATNTQRSPANKWELRAAQPGRAWISSSGSDDMRMIDIGDTVDGLGRITSISYQNGRWIINGTLGSISQ